MDVIFVKQGEYEKGDAAVPVIREAARIYAEMNGRDPDPDELIIKRTSGGKPYLDLPREEGKRSLPGISITHSGDIWMCLFSDSDCGIDFQYVRSGSKEKIADRFFTEGEKEYIENGGDFFDVWCRREALGKYTCGGWFGSYPDSCPGGGLKDNVTIDGTQLHFHVITGETLEAAGITAEADFRCVVLSESEEAPLTEVI